MISDLKSSVPQVNEAYIEGVLNARGYHLRCRITKRKTDYLVAIQDSSATTLLGLNVLPDVTLSTLCSRLLTILYGNISPARPAPMPEPAIHAIGQALADLHLATPEEALLVVGNMAELIGWWVPSETVPMNGLRAAKDVPSAWARIAAGLIDPHRAADANAAMSAAVRAAEEAAAATAEAPAVVEPEPAAQAADARLDALTARQREVYDVILRSVEEHGVPPTVREIGEALGIASTNGVADHLRRLEVKGLVTRAKKGAGLRLVPRA